MHHAQGKIIIFPLPDLLEYVVISPKVLVDALRLLFTDERFCDGDRLETVKLMNLKGLLRIEDINPVWKSNKQFHYA